ncbi:hypothetical protein CEXT_492711 [Caerostris extrusa]|uniref:Uncharacterized protein n=1 Tax=Caerostris extrusa TaxID=172846 RepID=A0AAV4MIX9_CAEEX|nr:hypothetical protein CEXT_492711 [Caerostris extrusa]
MPGILCLKNRMDQQLLGVIGVFPTQQANIERLTPPFLLYGEAKISFYDCKSSDLLRPHQLRSIEAYFPHRHKDLWVYGLNLIINPLNEISHNKFKKNFDPHPPTIFIDIYLDL